MRPLPAAASESADPPTLRLTLASVEDGGPPALTACSVCLRVRHASGWVDAKAVIRSPLLRPRHGAPAERGAL